MRFLVYGDRPRFATPLGAWPKWSRVGAETTPRPTPSTGGRVRVGMYPLTDDIFEMVEIIMAAIGVTE